MPVKIHNLASVSKTKPKKRLGRGNSSGKGTYSTRGIKGQKARSGSGGMRKRSVMRQLIKKIPKLRGYRSKVRSQPRAEVDVARLSAHFADGETVTPETLVKRGLVLRVGGKLPDVKLLGSGEVSKKLLVKDCAISAGARVQIEKAGGSVAA